MKKMSSNSQIAWIYWGTMISSLGTFTFPGATVGILTQMQFAIWQIGLLMSLTRAGTILGNFIFGDISDRFDAKKVVLLTEIIAFVLSGLLMFTWSLGAAYFPVFALCVFLRFITISVGGPGRNVLLKVLSDQYNKSHFHSAITLNAVTYGPGVVGSILGFFAIKYFSYYWVLGFDAITFIINGIIISFFVKSQTSPSRASKSSLFSKFKIYFSHSKLVFFDVLLAIPFMGTNVLMARLSDGIGYRVPVLLATFGLGAVIAPFLLRLRHNNWTHSMGYISIAASFLGILFLRDSFVAVVLWVLLRNVGYWYLFNLYTGHFQAREDTKSLGSLFSARSFIVTSLLGIGEFLAGSFGEIVSLNLDLSIRAVITVTILLLSLRVKSV